MTRLFTYATFVVCLGATATLAISNGNANLNPNPNADVRFAADGAFRDGLYLGRLAAEDGQPMRAAIGRWSTKQDRSRFAAGYRRGYGESLSGTVADVERSRSTE
jgi:hypothetical protein